jgi:hypothetical protein
MPLLNDYNLNIANQAKDILQKKIDFDNLHTDNIVGGSGFAMATHLDTGFGPTLGAEGEVGKGLSAGNGPIAGAKPRKRGGNGPIAGGKPRRKKGGDLNDILNGVSSVAKTVGDVASTAIPIAERVLPLLAAGKKKPRKKGGAVLGVQGFVRQPEDATTDGMFYRKAVSVNDRPLTEPKVQGSGISGGNGLAAGKVKRVIGGKMQARNALIKKIMSEHKMTLPQASKYIREHNLSY